MGEREQDRATRCNGGAATPPTLVGDSLSGFVKRLAILLLMGFLAAVFVLALRLWCVVFAGLLLGVFLHRISAFIEQRTPVSYTVSLGFVLTTLGGLATTAGLLVVPRFGSQMEGLSEKLSSSAQDVAARVGEWAWIGNLNERMPKLSGQLLGGMDATSILGGVFSSISAAATAALLVLFVGVFLAFDPELYRRGLLLLIPPRHRYRAEAVMDSGLDTLWWWTVGRLFAMTVIAVATSIGLWLLGVPMAFTLGTIAGLISFVPTIGAVLAIVPALLLALQQGPWTPAYVLALYVGIQALENNVLTPLVQQKAIAIPPVILIISQFLMGILVGIVGVVIATPLAALVIELVRQLYVQEPPDESSAA